MTYPEQNISIGKGNKKMLGKTKVFLLREVFLNAKVQKKA